MTRNTSERTLESVYQDILKSIINELKKEGMYGAYRAEHFGASLGLYTKMMTKNIDKEYLDYQKERKPVFGPYKDIIGCGAYTTITGLANILNSFSFMDSVLPFDKWHHMAVKIGRVYDNKLAEIIDSCTDNEIIHIFECTKHDVKRYRYLLGKNKQ